MKTISILVLLSMLLCCEREKNELSSSAHRSELKTERSTPRYCRYHYWGDCEEYMTHERDTVITGKQMMAVYIKLHCASSPSYIDTVPALREKNCDYHIYSYRQNSMEITIKSGDKESTYVVTPLTFLGQFEISGNQGMNWLARKGYIKNDYDMMVDPADSTLQFRISIVARETDIAMHGYFQINPAGILSITGLEPNDLMPPC